MSEAGDVCREAAAIIREQGWLQHDYGEKGGPHCMTGALVEVEGPIAHVIVSEAYQALSELVGKQLLSSWNDAPGRTKEEVLALLESVP